MKRLFLLPALMAALFLPTMVQADVSGSFGVDSDYFWRGASQNDGDPALSFNLEYQGDGFYAGSWGSHVNVAGEKDYEWDFYAGYALAITDRMSLDVGVIHYTYDTLKPDLDEVYGILTLDNWKISHYRNIDAGRLAFTEVEYLIPFISQLDVSLMYSMHSDEYGLEDGDYFGMKLSKDYGNVTLSAMVMDGARHGDAMDNASIGIHYNF